MDSAPLTVIPYARRRRDALGRKVRDHGPGPEKQPVEYYQEMGYSRKRRGSKIGRVELIGTTFITYPRPERDPTIAPAELADEFSPVRFRVKSQRGEGSYIVLWTGRALESSCDCPDWKWGQVCKHIRGVRRWRKRQRDALVNKEVLEDELLDGSFEEGTKHHHADILEEADRQIRIIVIGPD